MLLTEPQIFLIIDYCLYCTAIAFRFRRLRSPRRRPRDRRERRQPPQKRQRPLPASATATAVRSGSRRRRPGGIRGGDGDVERREHLPAAETGTLIRR